MGGSVRESGFDGKAGGGDVLAESGLGGGCNFGDSARGDLAEGFHMAEDLGELSGELCRLVGGESEAGQRGNIRNVDLGRRHMLERVGRKKAIRKKERGG